MPSVGDVILAFAVPAVAFLIPVIGSIIFRLSKQRKLLRFLGLGKESRRVIVYLSSLSVPRFSSLGFDGQLRSYEGLALPTGEFSITAQIPKAFDIDPFKNVPSVIRRRLEEKSAVFRPLQIDINASPMCESDMDFTTGSVITVGSQGYNIVTNYCVQHNLSHLQISNNGSTIQIVKGQHHGEVITRASAQHDIAILERLVDGTRHNTTVITAAGLAVLGTMGAVRYLIDHWRELDKTYGDRPFALALQFGPLDRMPFEEALKGGTVIRRLPES